MMKVGVARLMVELALNGRRGQMCDSHRRTKHRQLALELRKQQPQTCQDHEHGACDLKLIDRLPDLHPLQYGSPPRSRNRTIGKPRRRSRHLGAALWQPKRQQRYAQYQLPIRALLAHPKMHA